MAAIQGETQIRFGRRRFGLERITDHTGQPQWVLRGARGAVYATQRFQRSPQRMYLMSAHTRKTDPLGPVVLEEIDGQLRWISGAANV